MTTRDRPLPWQSGSGVISVKPIRRWNSIEAWFSYGCASCGRPSRGAMTASASASLALACRK